MAKLSIIRSADWKMSQEWTVPPKNAATHTTRRVFVGVFGLRLGSDGHKPLQDCGGEALVLNLGLLAAWCVGESLSGL